MCVCVLYVYCVYIVCILCVYCVYIHDTNVDPKYINSEFMHMRYVCIHVAVADTNANIVTF